MFLLNILTGVLLIFPIIVFHEFGHALTGRLFNFQIFSLVIGYGRNLFQFEIFKIPVKLNLVPTHGLTFGFPKSARFFKTRMWFFILGGIITHIILVLICRFILGPERFVEAIHPAQLFSGFAPLTAFIYVNAFIFILNIIPVKLNLPTGTYYSDGFNLLAIPFRKPVDLSEINLLFDEMRAINFIWQEQYPEALEIYQKLKDLKPENYMIDLNIGQIELMLGNLERSKKMFTETLERLESEKDDHEKYKLHRFILYNNIAYLNVVTFREDLMSEANDYSKKAIEFSPKMSNFLGTRGAVLVRLGRITEGIELLKRAFKQHSEPSSRSAEALFIGIGEAKRGNKKEALKWLEKARRIHSQHYLFKIAEGEIIETNSLKND